MSDHLCTCDPDRLARMEKSLDDIRLELCGTATKPGMGEMVRNCNDTAREAIQRTNSLDIRMTSMETWRTKLAATATIGMAIASLAWVIVWEAIKRTWWPTASK